MTVQLPRRVAVIVTGSDRVSATPRCLEALVAHTPAAAEIVLVQTPAPDFVHRAIAAAQSRRPIAVLHRPNPDCQNVQRNAALAYLHGEAAAIRDHYAFVDTDTIVGAGWLECLIAAADIEGADLTMPLLLYGEAEAGIVHMAGGRTHFRPDADGRPGMDEIHDGDSQPLAEMRARIPSVPFATDLIEFHCLLVSGRALARIGSFDPALEGCMEHVDLSLDVAKAGGRMIVCPAVAVACLHGADYEVCDAAPHAAVWHEAPSARTLRHFAKKQGLAADGAFFRRQHGWNSTHRESIGVVRRPRAGAVDATHFGTWAPLAARLAVLGWTEAEIAETQRCHTLALANTIGDSERRRRRIIVRTVGAASVLSTFGLAPPLVQAALLHRLYDDGDLAAPGRNVAVPIRGWVAERVGRGLEEAAHDSHVTAWAELPAPKNAEAIARYPLSRARTLLIHAAAAVADPAFGREGGMLAHARAILPALGFADLLQALEAAASTRPLRGKTGNGPAESLSPDVLAAARCPHVPRPSIFVRLQRAIAGR